jgi:hypothetical protein
MSVSLKKAIKLVFGPSSRDDVHNNLMEGKAVICPCCDQHAMICKRKITDAMARQLKRMSLFNRPMSSKEIQTSTSGRERMYSLLRFWDLVEKTEESDSWSLHQEGTPFCGGKDRSTQVCLHLQ